MDRVNSILHDYKLKSTKIRQAVLSLFLKTETGLSHTDISRSLNIPFDRVTLFRTLSSFEEAGVLHKIIGLNGTAQYAISSLNKPENKECHAHFICLRCEEIFCIDTTVDDQFIKIPFDFQQISLDIKVKGYCNKCLAKNTSLPNI